MKGAQTENLQKKPQAKTPVEKHLLLWIPVTATHLSCSERSPYMCSFKSSQPRSVVVDIITLIFQLKKLGLREMSLPEITHR